MFSLYILGDRSIFFVDILVHGVNVSLTTKGYSGYWILVKIIFLWTEYIFERVAYNWLWSRNVSEGPDRSSVMYVWCTDIIDLLHASDLCTSIRLLLLDLLQFITLIYYLAIYFYHRFLTFPSYSALKKTFVINPNNSMLLG